MTEPSLAHNLRINHRLSVAWAGLGVVTLTAQSVWGSLPFFMLCLLVVLGLTVYTMRFMGRTYVRQKQGTVLPLALNIAILGTVFYLPVMATSVKLKFMLHHTEYETVVVQAKNRAFPITVDEHGLEILTLPPHFARLSVGGRAQVERSAPGTMTLNFTQNGFGDHRTDIVYSDDPAFMAQNTNNPTAAPLEKEWFRREQH